MAICLSLRPLSRANLGAVASERFWSSTRIFAALMSSSCRTWSSEIRRVCSSGRVLMGHRPADEPPLSRLYIDHYTLHYTLN